MKLLEKTQMMCLATYTAMYLEQHYYENLCEPKGLKWKNYHGFPVSDFKMFNIDEYGLFDIDPNEITLQIGRSKNTEGDNSNYDHHHEKGQQLVMAIGKSCGFPEPSTNSYVKIKSELLPVKEFDIFFFKSKVLHGFRGDFYFINIQNPPLEQDGKDDFV